jgi:hypothetical protein
MTNLVLYTVSNCNRWLRNLCEFLPDHVRYEVMQLHEALRYKPEGCWFDYRRGLWSCSLTSFFPPRYGPGIDSVSTPTTYRKLFLGVKGGR